VLGLELRELVAVEPDAFGVDDEGFVFVSLEDVREGAETDVGVFFVVGG
jgi:hypothetical protein